MMIYGGERMLTIIRKTLSVKKEKELENIRAELNQQKEELETQKLMTQYVADMSDVYIPSGEETEENERNVNEVEREN